MKNTNKEIKKNEFSISTINRIISKINKFGLVLIIAIYILILSFTLSLVGKDISYVNEPSYEHQLKKVDISPQITLVGNYSFEHGHAHAHTKYSVNVNIAGKQIDNKDPKYRISNFRMFAATKESLTAEKNNSNYYFTEHDQFSTPITHTFSIDSSHEGIHPSTFYVRLQYEKDEATKVRTFKENVFLQPTEDDVDQMNAWFEANKDGNKVSAANIYSFNDQENRVARLETQCYMDTEDGKETGIYKAGVRVVVEESVEEQFHIDMQTWIVTEDGEYLPFIGVYNYTGPSKKFTNSLKDVNEDLKPRYIVAKVVYYDTEKGNEKGQVSYFKQDINNIQNTFTTNTQTGSDAGEIVKNNKPLYIALTVIASVAAVGLVVSGSLVYLKKFKKEEN